uniref:Lysine--tRNA ligase n=1 Tax=Romanomermis culicivorax TaxID=13658 RepID=A0A915JGN2_ROMCU
MDTVVDNDTAEKQLSKNAKKRKEKEEKKLKEKLEKSALKQNEPTSGGNDLAKNKDDAMSEKDYYNHRVDMIKQWRQNGDEPYPHKFRVSIGLSSFVQKYECLKPEEHIENDILSVAGRVHAKRESSQKLIFYDIRGEGVCLQIMANARIYEGSVERFAVDNAKIRRGDILGVRGYPARTKTGELSVIPLSVQVLTPSLHPLPQMHFGLRDQETRYRRRYLDLIMNESVKRTFVQRARLISYMRKFFDSLGFLEVGLHIRM